MKLFYRSLIVIAIISPLLAYTLWPLHFMDWNDNMIDQGWAISVLCLFYVLMKLIEDNWIKVFGKIGFWLAVNNALDEFVFDPLNTDFKEYLFAITITIIIIYEAWHKYQTNLSTQK